MNLSRTTNPARRLPKRRPAAASVALITALVLLGAPAVPARADCDDCPCQGSIWCASGTCWLSGTFCVNTVTIASGATLNFSGELTICGSGGLTCNGTFNIAADSDVFLCGVGSHFIGGTVNLQGSGSTLTFGALSTLTGSGEVAGQHDSAQITIASGATLTSCLSTTGITGALQITGNGTFDNRGKVNANYNSGGNETLLLTANTVDDSTTNDDRWIVSAPGAILKFDASIGTLGPLDGHFVMVSSSGAGAKSEIQIYHSLDTNGRLQMDVGTVRIDPDDQGGDNTVTMGDDENYYMDMQGGTIEVAAGETFTHY